MLVERRERQQMALAKPAWHLCNQEQATKPGWIPDLPWEARISLKVQRNPSTVFTNLMKHIDTDHLYEAFKALDGSKALGVDGVSKEIYARNLEDNLKSLAERVQRGSYRPQNRREVLIPKANGGQRSLAIACFEDKLVDWVISKILSAVYEPLFIRNSFGYRPSKSAHDAVRACYAALEKNKRPHVVEIDFKSFFDTIPHRRLLKGMSQRIRDHRLHRLIRHFLKSGILRQNEEAATNPRGTPQGGIMSPVLANIYLHEVLDSWFIENWASRSNTIVRYADDAVFFFHKEEDAKTFLKELENRVQSYGLKLHPDKTRLLNMDKVFHESFDFLSFTFYWGKQGSRRTLKIKTQKSRLHKAIREFYHWCKGIRNQLKLAEIWGLAKAKIAGHLNYFGFAINNLKCNHFCYEATRSLFKWLNRRSQKRSYNWDGFLERLRHMPLYESFDMRKWKDIGRSFGRI